MAGRITEAMQQLGMAGGRFDVALVPQESPQSYGAETVEFLVAGHAGSTPRRSRRWRRAASCRGWRWRSR
jgi:DNA repair protein RecN (Recombination protein N)